LRLFYGGHEGREANIPNIPGKSLADRVHNALLDDGYTLVGEEVLAPAGQRVRLDDQPSAVQFSVYNFGLQGVHRKYMTRMLVGIAPPVACSNPVPRKPMHVFSLIELHF